LISLAFANTVVNAMAVHPEGEFDLAVCFLNMCVSLLALSETS